MCDSLSRAAPLFDSDRQGPENRMDFLSFQGSARRGNIRFFIDQKQLRLYNAFNSRYAFRRWVRRRQTLCPGAPFAPVAGRRPFRQKRPSPAWRAPFAALWQDRRTSGAYGITLAGKASGIPQTAEPYAPASAPKIYVRSALRETMVIFHL